MITNNSTMTNEEINHSEGTEGQSQGVNIYDEIKKEIQRVIDSENPNDKGQDEYDKNYWERNNFLEEDFYNSQSEGRDIN